MGILFAILALVSFITVMGVVVKIREQKQCPGDDDLRKAVLFRNKHKDPKIDRIIAHLGVCKKCRDRVSELNANS